MAKVSFHNKNEKQNGGGKITDELQLGSQKEAKLAFTSFRSKYNGCKKKFKHCNHSGTISDRVQKAKKDSAQVTFAKLEAENFMNQNQSILGNFVE